jgi:signal-transduction protein with cAMP-binding, CBS, and nucleotidyltransferase domain
MELRTLPLFSGLSPDALAQVESRLKRREYAPQTVIVREGGPGDAMFIVRNHSGREYV